MSELVIRGGRVIDPAAGVDGEADVLIRDGRVAEIGEKLSAADGAEEIDAAGLWVVPGLIDMHVHLREPGGEEKETIESGARAAAAGGFACVLAMPNTTPPIDKGYLVRYVMQCAREAGGAQVLVAAALTEGRRGEAPSNMSGLARAGAGAFTDDGDEIRDARVLRACMREAARLDLPVLCHAEDPDLVEGGVMNEGALASRLGLPGRPALAEELAVARDIALARETGCRVHIQHVSTAGAVEIVRSAKADGVRVTCEATPHHLLLTEEACREFDPNAKMNPPLRTEADRQALVDALGDALGNALADGTIDAVATDHAPHTADEKGLEFDMAAAGVVGLETSLGLVLTDLVATGKMTPARMVELMSAAPARILGLDTADGLGSLRPGARANVTLIDPAREWTVDPASFVSKSRNTPFAGRTLRGRAVATVVHGRVVFRL